MSDHSSDTTSPLNQWEALKCVVRGVLIQHGSRLKRIRADDIRRLLSIIAELEPLHKRDLDPLIFIWLSNAHLELLFDLHSLVARGQGM